MNFYNSAVQEENRNSSFILQKCSLLVKAESNLYAEISKLFEESVFPLLQLAFSWNDKTPLPKELADQYMKTAQPILKGEDSVAQSIANEEDHISLASLSLEDDDEECFLVAHAYSARDEREMTVEKGQIISVKKRENAWVFGTVCVDGECEKSGWIPETYIKEIK